MGSLSRVVPTAERFPTSEKGAGETLPAPTEPVVKPRTTFSLPQPPRDQGHRWAFNTEQTSYALMTTA